MTGLAAGALLRQRGPQNKHNADVGGQLLHHLLLVMGPASEQFAVQTADIRAQEKLTWPPVSGSFPSSMASPRTSPCKLISTM